MMDYISVLFGVHPDKILKSLIDAVYVAITDRFVGIRVHDLTECFKTAEIEKKQYVSISRDEVIEPIQKYWKKKQFIISKIRDKEMEVEEQEKNFQSEQDFIEESKSIFEKSKEEIKWLGSPFHAFVLVKEFPEITDLPQDLKMKMYEESKKIYNEKIQPEKELFNTFNFVNAERIYAGKLVEHHISNLK